MKNERDIRMPMERARELLSLTDDLCRRSEQISGELRVSSSRAKKAALLELFRLRESLCESGDTVETGAGQIYYDLLCSVRGSTMKLYHAGQYAGGRGKSLDLFREGGGAPVQDRVFVRLGTDAVYIRTPMLWATAGRRLTASRGSPAGSLREVLFRSEILHGIRSAPGFFSFPLERFRDKLIHFLYVYAEDPSRRSSFVDNDSHATKYVQDAVTALLPGGDSPLVCAVYSSALLTGRIPESTLITVTPRSAGPKTDDELLHFWEPVLAGKTLSAAEPAQHGGRRDQAV